MSPITNLALRAAAAFASATTQTAAPASSSTAAAAASGSAIPITVTPHPYYSSSVGVLGCKIDTDRVAYWPEPVDCQNICVQVSYKGRSLNLLHIDHSGGAHDISYDAYSILTTGQSADDSKSAAAGGDMPMTYTVMPPSACGGLLYTGKLPLEASNSMDYLSNCLQNEPDSFAAKNYELWNMADSTCTLGVNEKCTLNWPAENDPTCPSQLGVQTPLSTQPTHNVEYPSGKNETITYDT